MTTTTKREGIVRTIIRMRPQGYRSAPALAVGKHIQSETGPVDMAALDGQKVTVLQQHRDTGHVEAVEGTVAAQGEILLSKGSRTKGTYLDRKNRVLAVQRGYGKAQHLAQVWDGATEECLPVEEATFDDLPVYTGESEPPDEIAAVYQFTHPGFDGHQDGRGSLFFATDIQVDSDGKPQIVNGYGVYAADSGLYSENGSMYTDQLSDWGGRVSNYQAGSLQFGDVMKLGSLLRSDMDAANEAVRTGVVPK